MYVDEEVEIRGVVLLRPPRPNRRDADVMPKCLACVNKGSADHFTATTVDARIHERENIYSKAHGNVLVLSGNMAKVLDSVSQSVVQGHFGQPTELLARQRDVGLTLNRVI